jgi:hypothetical protein
MALQDLPETRSELVREFVRHWSPRILIALAVGCVGARLALGGFGWVDALIAAALVGFWPVQEWLIHVFILHYRPVRVLGRRLDFSVAIKHRRHHADPWDVDLIFIPLEVYVFVPALIAALMFGAISRVDWVFTFLAVYFVFSLHYEWVHYLVHTRYRPTSRFYARLWQNHRLHHFKNEHYWFGVTMLGGDRLLRTAPDRDAVETSPTCRNLDAAA